MQRGNQPGLPLTFVRPFVLVAGARFGADSELVPVVTARWLYAGVRQEAREMVRVGLAA